MASGNKNTHSLNLKRFYDIIDIYILGGYNMAKKIVRGITDVKTINNQDFDTNNVNDLLSDGQYNYIHRKKGEKEEYHNLTDNIKTISSDNTELLSVTNNNKTTNTATLHPKHDAQKEQLLESTRDTIAIHHGTNGTDEKTTVDTNPLKVLEHENLISNSQYVTIEHEEDSNTSEIKTDKLVSKLNELNNKIPTNVGVRNLLEKTNQGKTNWAWSIYGGGGTAENYDINGTNAVKLSSTATGSPAWSYIAYNGLMRKLIEPNTKYTLSFDVFPSVDVTFSTNLMISGATGQLTDGGIMNRAQANRWTKVSCVLTSKATLPQETEQLVYLQGMPHDNGNWVIIKNIKLEKGFIYSDWSPAPEDIYPLLAQKQDKLTAGEGITIQGNTISATGGGGGGGETSTIKFYRGEAFKACEHRITQAFTNGVTSGGLAFITFSFECYPGIAEQVVAGELKEELEMCIGTNRSISNGSLTISYDGTNIKLMNSKSTEQVVQQATFTFYESTGGSVV